MSVPNSGEYLRVLAVDDEPLVRRELRRILARMSSVELVGEAENGLDALQAFGRLEPDVLLLDVQMPGLDGFEVLEALDTEVLPAVIFVTAFDEYALRAFQVHAVDYLLKPFDEGRVRQAIARARERIDHSGESLTRRDLSELLGQIERSRPGGIQRIPVRLADRISFVDVDEIRWIEASGNYIRLHTDDGSHLVRRTLKSMASRLRSRGFVQIHRSLLVDSGAVREIRPKPSGDATVVLDGDIELPVSRTYRDHFEGVMTGRE